MIIKNALLGANKKLNDKNITSASLDAEVLLSYAIKKSKEYLYTYPEKILSPKQISKFKLLVHQRLKGKPVAHLTGHKEFYGLNFYVDKNVLIPRPETELLVDEVIKIIGRLTDQLINRPTNQLTPRLTDQLINRLTVLDLGTGSGCIIISIVQNLQSTIYNLQPKFYATDISKKALAVARRNARRYKVAKKIKFLAGDLLQPIMKNKKIASKFIYNSADRTKNFLIIIANLPYLTGRELKNVPYEPKNALYGGRNGLRAIIRRLIQQISQFKPKNGLILLEISPTQTHAIKKIIQQYLPGKKVSIIKDLSGLDRVVKIE